MLYKIKTGAEGYRIELRSYIMEMLKNRAGLDCSLLVQESYLPYLKKEWSDKEEIFQKLQVVFDPENFAQSETPGVYLVCKSLATKGYYAFKLDSKDIMVLHESMIEEV